MRIVKEEKGRVDGYFASIRVLRPCLPCWPVSQVSNLAWWQLISLIIKEKKKRGREVGERDKDSRERG